MERAKRDLEAQLLEKKAIIEELEDNYQLAEDGRLRLEVNFNAAKTEFEKALQSKDGDGEDKRRGLLKQVRIFFFVSCLFPLLIEIFCVKIKELEEDLENERRKQTGSINAKSKLEVQVHDLEQQLDMANRLKEDSLKQARKFAVKCYFRSFFRLRFFL